MAVACSPYENLLVPGFDGPGLSSRLLFWPVRAAICEWVEGHVVLDAKQSAFSGPVNLDMTPYLRGILEAFQDDTCTEIDFKKSTQVGGTLVMMLMVAYAVDQDPGSTLFVMPLKDDAKDMSDERLGPILESTPELRAHLSKKTWDKTKTRTRFDRMDLHMAWAESAAKLASRAKRYVFADEVNKYPMFTGKESDPISLAKERQRTYRKKKLVIASTPTIPGGYIDAAYEGSDRCLYHVPCPACGMYQPLRWSNVKFSPSEWSAAQIRSEKLARYQCANDKCEVLIEESDKEGMVARGVWCPDGATVDADGKLDKPANSPRRGFMINALYSPWLTWSDVVAEFLESKGDISKLMNWTNSWMAEEWTEKVEGYNISTRNVVGTDSQLGVVLDEAEFLTAFIDMQSSGGDHVWYTVRAWGGDQHSWLIEEGRLDAVYDKLGYKGGGAVTHSDFDQVWDLLVEGTWEKAGGETLQIRGLGIDCAYRTDEVYAFAARAPERIFAIRGANKAQQAPLRPVSIDTKYRRRRSINFQPWSQDTNYFKDMLARMVRDQKWHIPEGVSGAYNRQFESQHRILIRDSSGRVTGSRWTLKKGYDDDHLFDCETGNVAVAYKLGYFDDTMQSTIVLPSGGWFKNQKRSSRR